VERATLAGPVLLIGGVAYFVDLFLRWGPGGDGLQSFTGWDVSLVLASGEAVLALILVEVARVAGIWRTPTASLLSCFLAAATAILGLSGLLHLRWGGFYHLTFGSFGYGSWIGLVLVLVLVVGAALRLDEHRPSSQPSS
jgi:hypothetical protein